MLPNEELLRAEVAKPLKDNLARVRTIFQCPANEDCMTREVTLGERSACLIYLEGMAGAKQIAESVLEPLLRLGLPAECPEDDCAQYLAERVLSNADAQLETRTKAVVEGMLCGKTALFVDGCQTALVLETRDYEKRAVSQTKTESVVKGSQEGFVENLRSNITLLRRTLHTPMLVTECLEVGRELPTRVAILYLNGVVEEKLLREVRRRVKSLDVDHVPGSGELMQLIEDHPFSLLPQMLETERPDRASSCLIDGQIVLLVDNSPYALVAPTTFFHLLHASDDTFMRWQYGTFHRLIRALGVLLSLLLPGLYTALTLYHEHFLPMDLLTSIAETRARVPFPVLVEVLIMEISFWLINEAGTRMPTKIGPALGIVGALILGQASVAAGIISPILIIVVALTGLGNYTVPSYGLGIGLQILRMGLLFAGAAMGLYGMALLLFLYICALCRMTSFGEPFLAPVAPYRPHNPDILLRLPLFMQCRRLFTVRQNSWLRRTPEDAPMRGWKAGDKEK